MLCRTDLTTCCASSTGVSGQGDWIYPNGTEVRNRPSDDDIFRTRGDMVVRLHRSNNATTPLGKYCCKTATVANPDIDSTICIILSKFHEVAA